MNAKAELLLALQKTEMMRCASLRFHHLADWKPVQPIVLVLKLNYNVEDFRSFFAGLDISYDNASSMSHLTGTIWLEDGSWLEREQNDWIEFWNHIQVPQIATECL